MKARLLQQHGGQHINPANSSQTTGLLIQRQQQRQQLETMQQTLSTEVSNITSSLRLHCNAMFSIVNPNISRIAVQPPPMQRQQNLLLQEHANNQLPAELTKTQRNLMVLREEWCTGIGGHKLATYFTPSERGAKKFVFSRSKLCGTRLIG
jgi:hypothetical protein